MCFLFCSSKFNQIRSDTDLFEISEVKYEKRGFERVQV